MPLSFIPSKPFRQICPVCPIYPVISYPLIWRIGEKRENGCEAGEIGCYVLEIMRHKNNVSDLISF